MDGGPGHSRDPRLASPGGSFGISIKTEGTWDAAPVAGQGKGLAESPAAATSPSTDEEPPLCSLCHLGEEEDAMLGPLLEFDWSTPKRRATALVHQLCAAWAPRAHASDAPGAQHGMLMVPEEVRRARKLRCKRCKKTGAAMGCEVGTCPQTYHLPCAMLQKGACFSTDTWTVYCPEHAELCNSSGSEDADMQEKRQALRRLRREQQQLRQKPGAGTGAGAAAAAVAAEAAAGAVCPPSAARKAVPAASRQKTDDSRQQPPAKRWRASEVPPGGALPAAGPSSKQPLAVDPRPNGSAAAAAAASAAAGPPPAANGKQASTGQGVAQTEDEPGASDIAELAVAVERVRQEKQRLQELKQQVQERHLVPPHQQHLEEHPQQQEEQPQQELSGAAQGVDDTAAAGQQQQLEEAQKQQQQQEQLQQGDEEGLPADVVGLVQEVYGRVAPDLAAQAQAYLWREGVRSFSDLRFVDTADYYENVTSSKMLLNKLFILAREREAAAAGGAAAATAAPAGPSS